MTDDSTTTPRRLVRKLSSSLSRLRNSSKHDQNAGDSVKLSVILPIYNSDPAHLEDLLTAIGKQSHTNWECIVVDDGSDGHGGVAVAQLAAKHDMRISVHERLKNGGIAAATNDALEQATGEWVLFCDHDDLILPGAFELIVRHIMEHPADDLIYTDEMVIDESGDHKYDYRKPDFSPERLLGHNYLCHIVTARRSLVEQVGGLDDMFEPVADRDFNFRATTAARSVGHIPEILYAWRSIPGSLAFDADAKDHVGASVVASAEAHVKRREMAISVSPSAKNSTLVSVHRPIKNVDFERVPVDPTTTATEIDETLRASRSKFVALVPTTVDEASFEPLLAICSQQTVALAGPRLLTNGNLYVSAGREHYPALTDLALGVEASNDGPWGSFCVNREVASVGAPGAVFDREAVLELGGLDIRSLVENMTETPDDTNYKSAIIDDRSLDLALALLGTALWLRGTPVIWTPLVTLDIDETWLRSPEYWAALADTQREMAAAVPTLLDDPYSPNGVHRT